MRIDDFFIEVPDSGNAWAAPEGTKTVLDADLMLQLASGTVADDEYLETAVSLTRLVRREYEWYGTAGENVVISDDESRDVLRTLRQVLQRQGIEFKPPWRDFSSFRGYWMTEGGYGSWQARRDIIETWFRPVQDVLADAEDRSFVGELTGGISPHKELGWSDVDDHIAQLRHRFRSASTAVDYKDVGNRCVGVLEALSAHVYDPAIHCPPGQKAPPTDKTDVRIGAFIDQRLPGKSNEELRGLVKKASALSHKMKHSGRADRTTTGVAADAVILLANILRRLHDA